MVLLLVVVKVVVVVIGGCGSGGMVYGYLLQQSVSNLNKVVSLFLVGQPWPLFHLFSVKQTIQFLQQINVKICNVQSEYNTGI